MIYHGDQDYLYGLKMELFNLNSWVQYYAYHL